MARGANNENDSPWRKGGTIPGADGRPAFRLRLADSSPIPVIIAAPHAGRDYPDSLLDRMRNPAFATLRLEDRYVDRLAEGIATQTGAALLIAHAPRAIIDLNRATDDIDWNMIAARRDPPERDTAVSGSTARRARSGLGLIPRRLPGIGDLWKRRHDEADLAARLAGVHRPYHECLAHALRQLRSRWGAALLIDLHSMPPLTFTGGQPPPEFVVGDRFGAACRGGLVGATFAWFAEAGRSAAHNRPYAGGYVLDRHADPRGGLHAIQLEIDRSSYLDSRLAEPGPGFAATVEVLAELVRRLAAHVAELGRVEDDSRWAEAAE